MNKEFNEDPVRLVATLWPAQGLHLINYNELIIVLGKALLAVGS